jgi:thiamine biosynthesis protein ThiS
MLVTNRMRTRLPLLDVVRLAILGGVDAIQIREKDLPDTELRRLAVEIMSVSHGAAVMVNGSVEIARDLGIGVHLPESGSTVAEARAALGTNALIGRSIHDPGGIAASTGAGYLIAGHVFESGGKPGLTPIGLDRLAEICAATDLPVLAIGGISTDNARTATASGAKGVAVMSAINESADPENAAGAIKAELDAASAEIEIALNGRDVRIGSNLTVQEFLVQRGFKNRLVVVEINGKIAPKASYSTRVFEAKDSVEIVHFVGGG